MKKLFIGVIALCASIACTHVAAEDEVVYDITKITTRSDMVSYLTRKVSDHNVASRYISYTCTTTGDQDVFAQAKKYTYLVASEAITTGEQPKNLYKDFLQALTTYNNQVDLFNSKVTEFRKVLNALTSGKISDDELSDAREFIQAIEQDYNEARYALIGCELYEKALDKAEIVNTAARFGS